MSGEGRDPDEETSEHSTPLTWAPEAPSAQPNQQLPAQAPTEPSPQKAWQPPPPPGWTPPPQPGPYAQPGPSAQPGPQAQPGPPAQQGWTPPPQAGFGPVPGSGPPPGPYQQPAQPWGGPPQYPGQNPYWAPPAQYGTSPLAVVAGVILLVVGVLMTLLGLLLLLVGAAGATFLAEIDSTLGSEANAIAAVLVGTAAIMLIIGILEIIGSVGVFVHKGWARWLGVVLGTIGLVFGFLLLIGTFLPSAGNSGDMVLALVWLSAHGFVVAALAAAGEHFQPAYPRR